MPQAELTVINPLLLEDEDIREQIADQCFDINTLHGALPYEASKIPDEGAWISVINPPHTTIDVPAYSIWRAKAGYHSHRFKILHNGRRKWVNWPILLAVILTPEGEVWLYPTEYAKIRDVTPLLEYEGRGLTLHYMGGEPQGLQDQVFYCQTRGLSRKDALLTCLGSIDTQDFLYMTIDEEKHDAG